MRYYLTADGGGTKTAFLLADETGRILSSAVLGPANYIVNGLNGTVDILRQGIEDCCKSSGVKSASITSAFFAIAGFGDVPEDIPNITEAVQAALPVTKMHLGNDTENALAGSLLGRSGIHIIAGTGSIGLGKNLDGDMIRCGGWHHLFGGDEGSGYWIGCRLLQHFTKQADRREDRSLLYDYMMDKYNLRNPEAILTLVIDEWKGKREKIASLSKDATALAKQNDEIALSIFASAGKELALIVKGIYDYGNFDQCVQISYSGGVFNSREYLIPSIEESLSDIPHVICEPILNPILGGIVLAMKDDGCQIGDKIIQNLKQTR